MLRASPEQRRQTFDAATDLDAATLRVTNRDFVETISILT
jgi:hypothetical protein